MSPKSSSETLIWRKSVDRTVPSVISTSYVRPVRLSVTDSVSLPSRATSAPAACVSVSVLIGLPLAVAVPYPDGRPQRSQPPLVLGGADRLAAVARPGLADGRREVVAHGPGREVQCRRDVGHGGVLARGGQHLVLARRQGAGALAERRGGQARIDDALARHRPPDRARELLGRGVLEQEAGGALLHRAAQVAGPSERGQDQDLAAGHLRPQLRGGLQAVDPRHLDVEQRDVRARVARRREHLVAARDLRDDLDVGLEREQPGQGSAHHRLVLGQQHADHRAEATGTTARTRNPGPSSRGPASRRPPAWRRRSCSPARPLPSPCEPLTPRPSSRISTLAWSSAGTRRIALWRAPLWRITLVAASRTVQASTASTSVGSSTARRSIVVWIPAASSAVRAPRSSASSAGFR